MRIVTATETEKVYLADFLKTNLTKFAVICVKKRQKARALSRRSSKIRKRKGVKERARRRKGGEEKQAMVALLVFIIPTLEIIFVRKKLFDTNGPFGYNV